MKRCNCDDWKSNIELLNAPIINHSIRYGTQYEGKVFAYCPWCGSELDPGEIEDAPAPTLTYQIGTVDAKDLKITRTVPGIPIPWVEIEVPAARKEPKLHRVRASIGDHHAELVIDDSEILRAHAPEMFAENRIRALFDECLRRKGVASPARPNPAVISFPSDPPYNINNRPLTWLYTHCRAIGMTERVEPPSAEGDICLFTINLKARAEKAESAAPEVVEAINWALANKREAGAMFYVLAKWAASLTAKVGDRARQGREGGG